MSKRKFDRVSPFGESEGSLEEVANEIYGAPQGGAFDTGRVVARPTPIAQVWADVRQPRRAVPASIRMHWNGDPAQVRDLLGQWHIVACQAAGIARSQIDPIEIINGRGEGLELENTPAIFESYVALLRLAQDIKQVGLSNPISVVEQAGHYLIESGERRWLAYHLLHLYAGEEWAKIPVIKTDGRDFVWRQASENTARRSLNAIGMARQLALLIMAAREGIDGVHYDEFETLVLPGGCDRRFYAQVSNGNIHRIPKGMGERIQAAMGLSETQLSRYRNLLKLTDDDAVNDAVWVKADVEDWAERTIREVTDTLPVGKVREVIGRSRWGLEDLRGLVQAEALPSPNPSPLRKEGDKATGVVFLPKDVVRTNMGHAGIVISANSQLVQVKTDNGTRAYRPEMLTLVERPTPSSGVNPTPQPPPRIQGGGESVFEVGDAVEVDHTGEIGEVVVVNGESVSVLIDGDPSRYHYTELSSLEMTYAEFIEQELANDEVVFEDGIPSPVDDGQTLYPESPSADPVVERARQLAMEAMGDSHRQLEDRIKGRSGWGSPDGLHINFGGGEVFLDYGMPSQRRLPFAREQVAVRLLINGRDRLFRFNAKRLMDWKLSNMPGVSDKPVSGGRSGADKEHYPAQGIAANDRLLLARGSDVHEMLLAWQRVAVVFGDEETSQLISELRDMTLGEAKSLKGAGRLRSVLDAYYEHIQQVMITQWMEVALTVHFDHIQAVADE